MARPKLIDDDTVLAAARSLFLAHGSGVSTVDIARKVGLSQATLFKRFGDKRSLFLNALRPDTVDVQSIIGPPDEPEHLGRGGHLEALTLRLFDAIADVLASLQAIERHGTLEPEHVRAAHERAGMTALVEGLMRHVATLEPALDEPDRCVETLLMLVHGAVFMAASQRRPGRERVRAILRQGSTQLFGEP